MYQTDVQASQESRVGVATIQMEIFGTTPVPAMVAASPRSLGAAALRRGQAAPSGGGGSGCGGGGSWGAVRSILEPSRATFLEETG